MVRSFIDEKYFDHYFRSLMTCERFSDRSEQLAQIWSYFKSKTDIYFEQEISTIIENLDIPLKNVVLPLINQLTTGRQETNIYQKQKKEFYNLKNVNIYSKLNYPFATFWLGKKYHYPLEKYQQTNPYYFFSIENDLEEWKSFSNARTFYVNPKKTQKGRDILKSWTQLKEFQHHANDVIINDKYCLTSEVGIRENIIPIVQNLSPTIKNLIIFIGRPKIGETFDIKKTYEFLVTSLQENNILANLTIYSSGYTHHDRFILTNNFIIKSGDSFDYFNGNNTCKTKGTTLSITPIFNSNKTELQEYIHLHKSIIQSPHSTCIGSKSKNIIDFFN